MNAEPLSVVHEDARTIAVCKPPGQLVIPGRGTGGGPTLKAQVEARVGAPVFVVHRIDRPASGLVLFAKDAEAHRALNRAFEAREVGKTYLAVVLGPVLADGAVRTPIRAYGSGRMGVTRGGRPAVTKYRVLERRGEATLLEVRPETGKRHQIRVHLWSVGHPVLGDDLYGDPRPVGGAPRLMLHSLALELDTPVTGRLSLRAEPPPEFESGYRQAPQRRP